MEKAENPTKSRQKKNYMYEKKIFFSNSSFISIVVYWM